MRSHPRKPTNLDAVIGWAAAFLVVAVIVTFLFVLSDSADAGTVCRVQKQVFAHSYAQPLAVAAPIYWQIGQSVQQEAQATYQLRQSDEYLELLQLRGFKAGVDAVTISAAGSHGPPQPATLGHPAATGEESNTEAAAPTDFAARYPTLAAKCQRCHSGDSPKGDVWIDGTSSLDGPDAASKRDAIAAAIINERMPQGKPLDAQEQYNALVELFTESE